MEQREAESEEDWTGFGLIPPNWKKYWAIEITENSFKDVDFGLLFFTSRYIETFKRSTYTILDLLGDVGGLFGTL